MHGIIDGDIVVYRIAWSCEDVSAERLVKFRLRDFFERITTDVMLSDYNTYLTSGDKSNFRYRIDPNYKAHRKIEKPKWYDLIREALEHIPDYKTEIVYGMEADDAMGIKASSFKTRKDYCLLTTDKDLIQIPGWHYNFVKEKKFYVPNSMSSRYLYKQLLTGDSADNIDGVTGIGESIANSLIDCLDHEHDCYSVVNYIYNQSGLTEEQLIQRGRLLKIKQQENEPLWEPPALSNEEIKERAERLIKVDWKKSFDKFSKIKAKKLLATSQSECTSNTPVPSDSISLTG